MLCEISGFRSGVCGLHITVLTSRKAYFFNILCERFCIQLCKATNEIARTSKCAYIHDLPEKELAKFTECSHRNNNFFFHEFLVHSFSHMSAVCLCLLLGSQE